MALLLIEGWEWLSGSETREDIATRMDEFEYWKTSVGSGAGGLLTTRGVFQGLELDNGDSFWTRPLKDFGSGSDATFICGLYVKTPGTLATTDFIRVYCGATLQFTIQILATGELRLQRGGATTISTTTTTLSTSNEYYLEFKVLVNDTAGTFEVKIADVTLNNEETITATDHTDTLLDSKISSLSTEVTWNRVRFASSMDGLLIDDVYLADGSGSDVNDFQGNILVEAIEPNGDGSTTNLTPSSGSNFENVDDATMDSDTTYNTADADSELDLYTMTDITRTGDIVGVQVQANARITEASPRKLRLITRHGTTNGESATTTLADDTYRGRYAIFEQNPDTAAAWTNSDITDIECGVKRQG